ncbi:hypothetical protein ACP70R_007256 [Stipagrostis hirtigluma subsp. patula]
MVAAMASSVALALTPLRLQLAAWEPMAVGGVRLCLVPFFAVECGGCGMEKPVLRQVGHGGVHGVIAGAATAGHGDGV